MAQEKYGFFNSTTTDERSYDAADMATAFHALASDGVAALDTNLEVTAEGSTMRTLIGYGRAMVQGYYYQLKNDGSGVHAFTHTTEASLNRIDRIILRLDLTTRTVALAKLIGTAAATPVAPALTRDEEAYELSLAQVYINAEAAALLASNITDEREDDDVCGLIAPESLRRSAIQQMIDGAMDDAVRCSQQGLTESEQAQARGNINAANADDAKLKLYASVEDIGLTISETLTLADVIDALPDHSLLVFNPYGSTAGNISPVSSQFGLISINRDSEARVSIRFYPKSGNSIWVNYAYYAPDLVIGTWRQLTPVTEVSATLSSSAWSGFGPYTQSVAISGMTAANKAIVGLPAAATSAQYLAAVSALLHVTAQGTNTVTVTAEGTVPEIDIPILVEIVG